MSKLASILEDMFVQAKRQAGIAAKRTLGKGLRIELICQSSDIRLTLARENEYPSLQEWDTVTKFLPFTIEKLQPEARAAGKCFILTARFPSPRVMQLKF